MKRSLKLFLLASISYSQQALTGDAHLTLLKAFTQKSGNDEAYHALSLGEVVAPKPQMTPFSAGSTDVALGQSVIINNTGYLERHRIVMPPEDNTPTFLSIYEKKMANSTSGMLVGPPTLASRLLAQNNPALNNPAYALQRASPHRDLKHCVLTSTWRNATFFNCLPP